MLLTLIKKDILIAKSSMFITMLMVIAIPLFFMLAKPVPGALSPFIYMVILTELILMQTVSELELKSPKAPALLCATPYMRRALVQAKYLFFILLFAFCYVVHTFLSLIIDPSYLLDLTSVLLVLFLGTIIYGIYMPVEFKYGNAKAKFVFLAVLPVLSMGPMIFTNFLTGIDFSIIAKSIAAIPGIIKNIALLLLSACTFMVSLAISVRIFSNKEL